MRWRNIGPFRGGRVITVAGIAGQPGVYYFGSVDGGVWKTVNSGVTWKPIFDQAPVQSIGAIAVAPSDPNVIYVGTGEADMRASISFGDGVYKSTDAGQTWQHLGLDDSQQIGKIIVDPHDANIVLVAALGRAYGPNAERGVFRSADGGKTWQKALYKDDNTGAIDLCFDPSDSHTVYAALWNVHRPPWSQYPPIYGPGPGSGLYKSTDGGLTWKELRGNGFPDASVARIGIAVAPSEPRRIYAVVDTDTREHIGHLYRSDDAGETWQLVNSNDRRIDGRAWYFSQITVDPKNPDVVYLPNVAIYRSRDGGKNFEPIKGAPGGDDYHALWIAPDNPARMIQGSDQGVSVSWDSGATWSSWFNQPTAQFYHVTTDNQFPYWVYGAQQDSGTAGTTSRSDYGSITFRDWHPVGGGESGYIAPDPSDPNIIYAGDTYGGLWRYDNRTGQHQEISPRVVSAFGSTIAQEKFRFTWTSPLVFSPQDPHTLYFGSQYVLRTTDQGHSWQAISPDLTGCDPAHKSDTGEPTVANAKQRCYGVVYTIAPSPKDANVIWGGSDTGLIHVTRDGGKTWSDVTPSSPHRMRDTFADWSKITMIEASHFDAGMVYVALDRHRLNDFEPHIFRTRDFGQHWEDISGAPHVGGVCLTLTTPGSKPPACPDLGAPQNFVHVVREDPVRRGLLFAGTETGIYVSFDDGENWQSLQLNLPHASVRDLVIHGDDLVIATHGRSFWILDDITPLREIAAEMNSHAAIQSQNVHLFTPATAIRIRRSENYDTPLPPEEPAGENPPTGAIIDYWLKSPARGEVTLEILNSNHEVIRKYSSNDKPELPKEPQAIAPYWFNPPAPLSTGAGMHRFVWDLRYPNPPVHRPEYGISAVFGQNTPPEPQGPLVLPGKYEAKLTVDGHDYTEPFTVQMDPRVATSPTDLARQLDLALKVDQALERNFPALNEAQNFHDQLTKLKQSSANNAQVQSAISALDAKADALLKTYGAKPTLATVNAALAQIEEVVETADRAPTAQAEQAFAETGSQVESTLAEWQALKQAALPNFNKLLAAHNLPAIELRQR